jgi:retron-type reverse transcriptase
VSRQGPSEKPFTISKRLVWEAYEQVKRNKGAAGVDGQSIEEFEKDLRNNLYKIWLRREALVARVAVRDRHHPAVVAAG